MPIVAGLTVVRQPALRHFAGAVALGCGLLSLVQTDLGGFLLATTGGVPALAWGHGGVLDQPFSWGH